MSGRKFKSSSSTCSAALLFAGAVDAGEPGGSRDCESAFPFLGPPFPNLLLIAMNEGISLAKSCAAFPLARLMADLTMLPECYCSQSGLHGFPLSSPIATAFTLTPFSSLREVSVTVREHNRRPAPPIILRR